MATISYAWTVVVGGFTLNDETAGDQSDVAIAATADGGYLGSWSVGSADVRGRYVDADGTPGTADLLNTTTSGNQFNASMALLGNGHNVASFTDSSSGVDTIRLRILGDGAPATDFAVSGNANPQRESDVTALGFGGFAVAYTVDFGAGDTDVRVQRYNANGTQNGSAIIVDNNIALATDHASITNLVGGGFVVAWEQSVVAGGAHSVWFQLYDGSGGRLTVAGDLPNSHHLIDGSGSINQDIQVAALQDGGFVVAYADNGWGVGGTEITAQIYNADGTARGGPILVNTNTAGDQFRPTVTVLSNGYFTVGWKDGDALVYQAYSPQGIALGSNYVPHNIDIIEAEIVGLANGEVANVRESAFSDGDGSSVRSSVHALTRTILGTSASETLIGDDLRDLMNGDAGDDQLYGSGANDVLIGGEGEDVLSGGAGTDDLQGGIGDDQLHGDAADDVLTGGLGADALDGGAGIDIADYAGSAAGITVDLAAGTGSGGDAAGDTLTAIENLSGSQFADVLAGDAGANTLDGRFGDDVLRGGGGADTLLGGLGGTDTASYYTGAVGVTIDLAAHTASGGDAAGDTLSSIENISGSQGNDILAGDAGANKLQGWNGGDVLRGGAGADTLEGGADTDTASYFTGVVGVTVDLAAGTGSGGDAQGDTLSGIENISGSQGHDVLAGNAAGNKLQGWNGDDVLRGGAGADTLEGGAGNDTASYYTSSVGVAVSLAAGTASGGDATADALNSIENLSGSQQNDGLEGNAGANVLQGWAGNDALVGGGGKDTLTGGAGADRYYFLALGDSVVGANADVITDFNHGQADRIDLTAIDANAAVAGDQAFSFIGANLYTGVAGQLRYSVVGNITTVAGDVNGDKVSDFHITLTGIVNFIAADFVL